MFEKCDDKNVFDKNECDVNVMIKMCITNKVNQVDKTHLPDNGFIFMCSDPGFIFSCV